MDINKKLKILFAVITVLAVSLSVICTVHKPGVHSHGKTAEEIAQELQEKQELDTLVSEIRSAVNVNALCDSYIKLCSDTLDVTDGIKAKKAELTAEAEKLKTKAVEFTDDIDRIYNSEGLPAKERAEMLNQHEKYQAIKDIKTKCETLKTELDTAVKQYNDEQEAKKKAAAEAASKSNNSSSNGKSSSSSSGGGGSSRSSSSSGYSSSGSGSYSSGGSSSSYSGGGSSSSGGGSSSYSGEGSSSSGGSSSGGGGGGGSSSSESSGGGGYSGADLGSER